MSRTVSLMYRMILSYNHINNIGKTIKAILETSYKRQHLGLFIDERFIRKYFVGSK